MELILEGNDRLVTVRIQGNLDASTCRVVREAILELSNSGRNRVEIDLERTPTLDTSGVGVLVGLKTTLRARGGDLHAVNPQPMIRLLLERMKLDEVLLGPPPSRFGYAPGSKTGDRSPG